MSHPTSFARRLRSDVCAFRLTAAVALSSAALSPLCAQEVFGTLRRLDGSPAAGVVVVVRRAGETVDFGRTVTGVQGRYWLRLPEDSVEVSALRVGQRPVVLLRGRFATGQQREIARTLEDAPVQLVAFFAAAEARCETSRRLPAPVSRAFTEARTALLASQLVAADGSARVRYRIATEERSLRDDAVTAVSTTGFEADSLRAFRSAPVDSVLTAGFVVRSLDGGTIYRAPDAETLVDDRFLQSYCLHPVASKSSPAHEVGIGFRPVRSRRGIVEIEGTLWLDLATAELRRFEFAYLGLARTEQRTLPGGSVEFIRLPDGIWLAQRWQLRMPKVTTHVTLGAGRGGLSGESLSSRRTVTGVQVTTGEITEVLTGGILRFTVGATDMVHPSGALIGLPQSPLIDRVRCRESPDSITISGRVIGPIPTTAGSAAVVVSWMLDEPVGSAAGAPVWETRTVFTDSTGAYVACAVPRDRTLMMRASASGLDTTTLMLRPRATYPVALVDLLLPGAVAQSRADEVLLALALDSTSDARVSTHEISPLDSFPAPVDAATPARSDPTDIGSVAVAQTVVVTDEAQISIPFALVSVAGARDRSTDIAGRVVIGHRTHNRITINTVVSHRVLRSHGPGAKRSHHGRVPHAGRTRGAWLRRTLD